MNEKYIKQRCMKYNTLILKGTKKDSTDLGYCEFLAYFQLDIFSLKTLTR